MSTATSIQQLNRDLADRVTAEAQQNPHSPYVGKKVGIANGQIVVVSDSWDEVGKLLR